MCIRDRGITEENIIIYGESLGTGVATEIAQKKNFAGIILESPFTSMIAAGQSKYPIFPIKLLLKDKYESNKKIQNIPIIEFSACPKSNDIIGLQDLYLQLDINNSTVDMIADTITSGENTSGTLYTATSSYVTEAIARLTESEALNTNLISSDTYILGSPTTQTY